MSGRRDLARAKSDAAVNDRLLSSLIQSDFGEEEQDESYQIDTRQQTDGRIAPVTPTNIEAYSNQLKYLPLHFRQDRDSFDINDYKKRGNDLPFENQASTPVQNRRHYVAKGISPDDLTTDLLAGSPPLRESDLQLQDGRGNAVPDTWSSKLASLFAAGSIKSSIFNLCSATLGAGVLALPYAFKQAGVIGGLVLMLLGIVVSVYSIRLLIHVRDSTFLGSYEDMAHSLFGKRLATFVEINIVVFCFGTQVAYLVAMGDILMPVLNILWPHVSILNNRAFMLTSFTTLVVLPLSSFGKISSLRFSSLLGVLSIVWLVCVQMERTSRVFERKHEAHVADWFDDIELITNSIGLLRAIPVFTFAFCCQVNVFSIYTELQRPSLRRIHRVVSRSFVLLFLLYGAMGCAGYMAYGNQTLQNIMLNYNLENPLVISAMAGVSVTLITAFPLNVFPARFTLEMALFSNSKQSSWRSFMLTFVLVYGSLVLAVYVKGIDVVFSILGATCCAVVCFILPAMYYLRVWQRDHDGKFPPFFTSTETTPAWALFVSGLLLGVAGTSLVVYDLLNPSQDGK